MVAPLEGTWWWPSPCQDSDSSRGDLVVAMPMSGWWFLWKGACGGCPHVGMVASMERICGGHPPVEMVVPLEGSYWWLPLHWDGDSSRKNLVVAITPIKMVASLQWTWWSSSPRQDGGFSGGDLWWSSPC